MAERPPARVPAGEQDQAIFRGVAAVPGLPRSRFSDTADLPVVSPTDVAGWPERDKQAPAGMIVRRRWRRLRSGAGWSWTGVSTVVVCWGIWAVSVRGTDVIGPVIGLVLVLATAALLFVVARLLGRAVLERMLGRDRPSAWPSHLTVCGFLILVSLTFLQQTWWVQDSWRWASDGWRWLTDNWPG